MAFANLSVGRRRGFFLAGLGALIACAQLSAEIPPLPKNHEFTSDFAGLITREDAAAIARAQKTAFETHQVPLIVVTIHNFQTYGYSSIEPLATDWFNAWGIGTLGLEAAKRANKGILLLVSVGDRKARIELGAEWGHRWNGTTDRTMNNVMIPHFKAGNYSLGIRRGVEDLAQMASQNPAQPPSTFKTALDSSLNSQQRVGKYSLFPRNIGVPLLFLGGLLCLLGVFLPQYRKPLLLAGGGIVVVVLLTYLVIIVTALITNKGRRSSGGGFSSSGGFSGGSSGGGGSSGSW